MMCVISCDLFCKQKTAYDMRFSDMSSDVCSSDRPGKNSLPGFARHAPHRACRGNRVPAPLSSSCSCKDVCVAKTAEQRRRFLTCRPMSGVVVKTARHKCLSAAFNLRCQEIGRAHV